MPLIWESQKAHPRPTFCPSYGFSRGQSWTPIHTQTVRCSCVGRPQEEYWPPDQETISSFNRKWSSSTRSVHTPALPMVVCHWASVPHRRPQHLPQRGCLISWNCRPGMPDGDAKPRPLAAYCPCRSKEGIGDFRVRPQPPQEVFPLANPICAEVPRYPREAGRFRAGAPAQRSSGRALRPPLPWPLTSSLAEAVSSPLLRAERPRTRQHELSTAICDWKRLRRRVSGLGLLWGIGVPAEPYAGAPIVPRTESAPAAANRRFAFIVILQGLKWWAHKDSNLGPAD
jgi:hypothetical protein